MNENTETTGADRTKCAEWCGKEYGARGVPFRRSCGFPMYFEHGAAFNVAVKDNEPAWCSIACRDARLPPIAAPVAHVERRKVEVGQRRKSYDRTYTIFAIEGRCAFVCQDGDVDSIDGYVHNGGCCWESVSVLEDCELLADAPPEPAKLMCSDCSSFGTTGKHWFACPNAPKKSPPAQEAPKAAPALEWSFTDDENRVHRFATGGERDTASRAYGSWMAEQTGTPYAGPERLPNPQLAADWIEDCLGDVR